MVTVSSFMFVSVSFLIWSAIWGRAMARGRVLWAGACPGGRVVGVHGDHCLAAAASPDLVRSSLAHGDAAAFSQVADQHPGGHLASLPF